MRIGILGGTFNPIHTAHMRMAVDVKRTLQLDQLLFMPAFLPPHKEVAEQVSAQLRLAMTELAVQELSRSGETGFVCCDMELRRTGKSYTVDTLRELHGQYPDAELYLIVGSDMLCTLHTWYQAPELLRLATFAAIPRQDCCGEDQAAAERLRREYGAEVLLLPITVEPFSSTEIRERVNRALPMAGMVSPSIERFIDEQGLYLPEEINAIRQYCQAHLSSHRYLHTIGVMRLCMELAARYGCDGEQARLAGLLHDCAKGKEADPFYHAGAGAKLAQELFHVEDPLVLQAVRRHTVGAADMTTLDKIVYLADMLEPGRDFPGVEELRKLLYQDLDAALAAALRHSVDFVRSQGQFVHPASLEALAFLAR